MKVLNHIRQYLIKRQNPGLLVVGENVNIKSSKFEGYNAVHSKSTVKNCNVGLCTYIGNGSSFLYTKIGRYCSIADNVKICIGTHPTHFLTTFPSFYYDTTTQIGFTFHKGKSIYATIYRKTDINNNFHVEIGNDVWIGSNALILGGVRIGDGAIIGAGAVVTNDVEPYSIVGGVPARIIRKRFSQEQIEKLLKIKWWNDPIDIIRNNYTDYIDVDKMLLRYEANH